jgi:uncharacterized RDD family membrane protein YckC
VGPVDDEQLQNLASTGVIDDEGLVWRKGMPGWQKYNSVGKEEVPRPQYFKCVECGKLSPADEMVQYMGFRVCAACKPIYFQRLKEGARLPATLVYAGFWIRFAAKFIDGMILGVVNLIIQFSLNGVMMTTPTPDSPPSAFFYLGIFLTWMAQLSVAVAYTTFFVGKYAATPGKMACGLCIVTAEGAQISYMRAFGRYFAEMLSGLTLGIGYIMAAFDAEKRALHDRVCNTRVVRK